MTANKSSKFFSVLSGFGVMIPSYAYFMQWTKTHLDIQISIYRFRYTISIYCHLVYNNHADTDEISRQNIVMIWLQITPKHISNAYNKFPHNKPEVYDLRSEFLPRGGMLARYMQLPRSCVCLPVCVSVTSRCFTKMAKHRNTQKRRMIAQGF